MIKTFLLVFKFIFLFEVFLVLVCLIFEGLHFAVGVFLYFLWYQRFDFNRDLLPMPGSSIIVRNSGSDLLSRRDFSIRLLSCNIFDVFV